MCCPQTCRASAVIQVSYSASTMWGGGLWSDPLERPRGPRGRRGPTAPGTIPRESALGGPGHSAISRAASILVLFKLTHYPRVGCDSRGRLTLAKWGNRAQSVRGYLTLPIAFVRSSKCCRYATLV